MKKKKLLFIGDSLIEYFDWQNFFPHCEVYNYGVSGETTQGLFDRLRYVFKNLENSSPDLIMIMSGTNNMAMNDFGFLSCYESIITEFNQTWPRATIVATSLLPVQLPWLRGDIIPRMNTALQNTVERHKCRFLQLYNHFLEKNNTADLDCFLDDGVHLSDKGYKIWATIVAQLYNLPAAKR